uniref:Uncharacterized protein n=1 Tax=Opuntia streptacantha TaxID=393608 RepID=A0A7C9D361_OPUST
MVFCSFLFVVKLTTGFFFLVVCGLDPSKCFFFLFFFRGGRGCFLFSKVCYWSDSSIRANTLRFFFSFFSFFLVVGAGGTVRIQGRHGSIYKESNIASPTNASAQNF